MVISKEEVHQCKRWKARDLAGSIISSREKWNLGFSFRKKGLKYMSLFGALYPSLLSPHVSVNFGTWTIRVLLEMEISSIENWYGCKKRLLTVQMERQIKKYKVVKVLTSKSFVILGIIRFYVIIIYCLDCYWYMVFKFYVILDIGGFCWNRYIHIIYVCSMLLNSLCL
jgi:hypothetical protein